MKEGWKRVKLGDVATFSRGLTYSKNDEADLSDNVVLRSNNVELGTGRLVLDELKYLNPSFVIPHDKYVKKGSLLMCMSNGSKAHLGKVALIEEELNFAFGGFMGLVTPIDSLNSKYFFYTLNTPLYKDFIKSLSAGANINNIKIRDLQAFTLPLPPLPEQQRIVEHLDSAFAKIDALKANAEKMVEEAKALFASALKEAMTPKEGWEEKTLGEICSKIGSGATPKGGKKIYIQSGTSLIRSMNVHHNYFKYDELAHIDDNSAKQLDGVAIEKNDVLFNITGASIARCCVVPDDIFPARVNQHVCILRIKEKVLPMFLSYCLNSKVHQAELLSIGEAASTRQALTKKDMEEHIVSFPSLSEQQRIVSHLDDLSAKVRQLEANFKKVSAECDVLKQSILRETFE